MNEPKHLGELISTGLLAGLKQHFPSQQPSITATDREIWAAVGEQRLIAFLQQKHDEVFSVNREDF
jgi:hypothetical protein